MNLLRWFSTPNTPSTNRQNFLNVQVDAVGVGLANAASPFLPVFLTHLGATNFQVGLLTSMPAFTGFFLALVAGNFLQTRKNIVPWFSLARLMVIASYALTGLITMVVSEQAAVYSVLVIWALATLPQTVVSVAFSVVMNAVAGPTGRFELMSRRWSILGTTTAVTVILVGILLDRLKYPLNYQVVFIALSLGGLISFYFSSHIRIPDSPPSITGTGEHFLTLVKKYSRQVVSEKPFIKFIGKRFVYLTGVTLAMPLFPLYYVRVLHASDSWIGIFSTAQTAVLVVGYFFWVNQTRRVGSRRVLLLATLGMSLYPALVAITQNELTIAAISAVAGIFQAGIDLVFFDELMKTVPIEYSATFVAFAQSLQFLSMIAAPLIGTTLADLIGISGALIISAVIRLAGFAWFALDRSAGLPVDTVQNAV